MSVQSANIIGAGSGNRPATDFYRTPVNVTDALVNFLEDGGELPPDSRIWEPACGRGDMAFALRARDYSVAASDLYDFGYGVTGFSFQAHRRTPGDFIVTNPPFSEAEAFIEHALTRPVRGFAFLLKQTFWNADRRYALFERFRPRWVLPLTWRPAMDPDRGQNPTMSFQWVVWGPEPGEARTRLLRRPT